MASSGTSKYGLFISKKPTKTPVLKPAAANVFGDDSDEESGTSAVNQTVNRASARAKIRKQTQLEIDKALQEDPSVYEYDSIYDNIQAEKVSTDVKEGHRVDKKPKYIAGLLKMAEVRKREEERRVERKVQKEREEEGDLYADKEAFVTSAYKKKMLEQQEEAERERQEAAMEEMLDVTKQKDLSGFYRYLYRETTGTGLTESQDAEIKEEKVKVKEEPHSDADSDDAPSASRVKVKEEPHSDADSDDAPSARVEKKPQTAKDSRHTSHRHRRDSGDEKAAPKHRSSTEKSKANGSSRQRSHSREKERQRHRHRRSRSSSPAHGRSDKHRHRSRSRDRKRDRSSSRDGTRRWRQEAGRSEEEEGGSSGKEKRRRHSSREEGPPPSAHTKETSAKISSPPATDRAPSPEMLPARPPDEDLDRDDTASESASSDEEEASAGKREGQGQGEENSASKGRKKEEGSADKEEEPKVKYARKTTDTEMLDARQRFLARKLARERARPVVEPE